MKAIEHSSTRAGRSPHRQTSHFMKLGHGGVIHENLPYVSVCLSEYLLGVVCI